MLAGLAVIPTIFALAPAPEAAVASGNTGLAFIHFPLWFVLIFSWWTWQAASWYPGEWYKWLPISKYTFSVGTMYYQWAICFGIIFLLNNWLAEKTRFPAKVDFD